MSKIQQLSIPYNRYEFSSMTTTEQYKITRIISSINNSRKKIDRLEKIKNKSEKKLSETKKKLSEAKKELEKNILKKNKFYTERRKIEEPKEEVRVLLNEDSGNLDDYFVKIQSKIDDFEENRHDPQLVEDLIKRKEELIDYQRELNILLNPNVKLENIDTIIKKIKKKSNKQIINGPLFRGEIKLN